MPESPIEFHVINFFHLFLTNHFYNINITGEVGFVRALLVSMHPTRNPKEIEQRKEWEKIVEDVWNITTDEINTKLTFVELAYNKNVQRGLNKYIEIQDNNGIDREYNTAQLYHQLKVAESRLVQIVVTIASYYNLVIPVGTQRGGVTSGYQMKPPLK